MVSRALSVSALNLSLLLRMGKDVHTDTNTIEN